jgi:hypothetical protein
VQKPGSTPARLTKPKSTDNLHVAADKEAKLSRTISTEKLNNSRDSGVEKLKEDLLALVSKHSDIVSFEPPSEEERFNRPLGPFVSLGHVEVRVVVVVIIFVGLMRSRGVCRPVRKKYLIYIPSQQRTDLSLSLSLFFRATQDLSLVLAANVPSLLHRKHTIQLVCEHFAIFLLL